MAMFKNLRHLHENKDRKHTNTGPVFYLNFQLPLSKTKSNVAARSRTASPMSQNEKSRCDILTKLINDGA
jgi:hypothetical protein